MYKRNQVEEAISRLFGERTSKPSTELRTRIKRLLDLDRSLGRNPRSTDPEKANYAFYSAGAPGKGVEVQFSEYEAFALSLGLRLLEHGWPQGFAIAVLRRLRKELERQHSRFMKQDPNILFDEEAIRRQAKPGSTVTSTTDPVFLIIVSSLLSERPEEPVPLCAVCHGELEMFSFVKAKGAASWSTHELVAFGHALSVELKKIPPRPRGRR